MYQGSTAFTQLMGFLPWRSFARIVKQHKGDRRVHALPCKAHFRILALAHLARLTSLREIEACLAAQSAKLYHMGMSPVRRSTLAEASKRRDWRIYFEFAQGPIAQAGKLHDREEFGRDLSNAARKLDAATLDLCSALLRWLSSRNANAPAGGNAKRNLRTPMPTFFHISDDGPFGIGTAKQMRSERMAICVIDRVHLPFERLFELHQAGALYIACANTGARQLHPDSTPSEGVRGTFHDRIVALSGLHAGKSRSLHLRHIRFEEARSKEIQEFLTNLFDFPPAMARGLCQRRRQLALLFKWINRRLRIERFYGTSENAVKAQFWIALSTCTAAALANKRLHLDASLQAFLQAVSQVLFEKIPLSAVMLNGQRTSSNDLA